MKYRNLVLEYKLRKLEKVVSGSMPKYFYHGTRTDIVPYVLEHGLKPSKEVGYSIHNLTNKNKVYLTATIDSAKSWASMASRSNYSILKIDSSYLNPDLLEGDYNALIDPFSEEEPDEDDIDRYRNLTFDDKMLLDYEYAGSIPPEAISVIYQSDNNLLTEFDKRADKADYKWFLQNWNKYIDADCGTHSYQDLFCGAVAHAASTPYIYGTNKKFTDIILSLPVDKLNYEWKNRWGDITTVLEQTACFGNMCDNAGQLLSDLANKFERTISDTNLKIVWKYFTKPKQSKNISIIESLPDRFLQIGKPYMSKKLIKQLNL
jgi:hypothetical protein